MERITNFLNAVLTATCLIVQYRKFFPQSKAAESSNHSPPSSAEFNNGCICTSVMPYNFMTCTVHKLVFFLNLRDTKRTQNSAWSLDYASGRSSMQWTEITWSSDRELLEGPTTTGTISPISTWRRKQSQYLQRLGLIHRRGWNVQNTVQAKS